MGRFWMMLLGAAALLLGACGDSGSQNAAAGDKGAIKVGLILPGSASDGGWNQLANEAMTKVAKEQGLDLQVRSQIKPENAADALRQFDAKGYALVIAHGFEYLDAAKELTDPAKPGTVKVKIAVSGGNADNPHFQSLLYDLAPASYELGVIAAKVSKTGKLAFIGGEPVPPVTAMKRGFEAGAKSVNPNATVTEQYTGWDDPGKAKKQVEAFIQQGCDVIMQNVDAASSGVFEAVAESNKKLGDHPDIYTFGANSDQNGNAICSDFTLASAVIRLDVAFGKVVELVKANSFKGGLVTEDVSNGVAVAVLNPKLTGKVIDADTQKLVEEAAKKLAAGQIKIPSQ